LGYIPLWKNKSGKPKKCSPLAIRQRMSIGGLHFSAEASGQQLLANLGKVLGLLVTEVWA
jgi:hypothetical protein